MVIYEIGEVELQFGLIYTKHKRKRQKMWHHDLQQEEAARMDIQVWWYPLQDT